MAKNLSTRYPSNSVRAVGHKPPKLRVIETKKGNLAIYTLVGTLDKEMLVMFHRSHNLEEPFLLDISSVSISENAIRYLAKLTLMYSFKIKATAGFRHIARNYISPFIFLYEPRH